MGERVKRNWCQNQIERNTGSGSLPNHQPPDKHMLVNVYVEMPGVMQELVLGSFLRDSGTWKLLVKDWMLCIARQQIGGKNRVRVN